MGLFDTVMVPCPKCGHREEGQTKWGLGRMRVVNMEDADPSEVAFLDGYVFTCARCGCKFKLRFYVPAVVEADTAGRDEDQSPMVHIEVSDGGEK